MARVLRNGQTESWHYGAAAVVTPHGGLVARIGDSAVATFLRSAAKPFQVLPLLAAGGRERFELGDADIALICASHSGRPEHVERVERLLERGGFSAEDLQCGIHPPLDEAAAEALADSGSAPTVLHNNCSGKHAGKLLACLLLGFPTDSYLERDHPLQLRIRDWLSLFCGLPLRGIGHALDGCSAPTFHLPLQAAARAYAALADPGQAAITPEGAALAGQVVAAMTGHPEMVAGPGRFTTRLMEVTGGRVLGKEGFEGFYGLAVRGPVALGVALKIADGSSRCRDGVVLDLLRQLGSLSAAELAELAEFHQPRRHNVRGLEVGEIVPDLAVEEA